MKCFKTPPTKLDQHILKCSQEECGPNWPVCKKGGDGGNVLIFIYRQNTKNPTVSESSKRHKKKLTFFVVAVNRLSY